MKSLCTAAFLALTATAGGATAATIDAIEMVGNDWVIFDLRNGFEDRLAKPLLRNGSFSYTLGALDHACVDQWYCLPQGVELNKVYSGADYNGGNFGNGWKTVSAGSVNEDVLLSAAPNHLFMFFRVTSGSAGLSQLRSDVTAPLAPVPLPAGAALLLGGIGALALLRKRRKTA